jgi:ParB family chromosome partitioning protein
LIRWSAARALIWVSRPENLGVLREVLAHADPMVKYLTALGLAYQGETSVAPLVFSAEGQKVLSDGERLAAGLTLGPVGEDWLVVALDDPKDDVRERALLLLMVLEWKAPQGTAARCLAALASRLPACAWPPRRPWRPSPTRTRRVLGSSWCGWSTTGGTNRPGRSPRRS